MALKRVLFQKDFYIAKSRIGKGVFTNKNFSSGEILMKFKSAIFIISELPKNLEGYDNWLQIGFNPFIFMSPSGAIDDFVNHSCDPNAGLSINGKEVNLIAIQNISAGAEITFDYSTTTRGDYWEMICECGNKICRKIIRDFQYLPKAIKLKYVKLGVVPKYNLNV